MLLSFLPLLTLLLTVFFAVVDFLDVVAVGDVNVTVVFCCGCCCCRFYMRYSFISAWLLMVVDSMVVCASCS